MFTKQNPPGSSVAEIPDMTKLTPQSRNWCNNLPISLFLDLGIILPFDFNSIECIPLKLEWIMWIFILFSAEFHKTFVVLLLNNNSNDKMVVI